MCENCTKKPEFFPPFIQTVPELEDSGSALDVQIGGSHYKKFAIQPIEFIHLNKIGFIEGCIIKYVTRWQDKNGIEDLEKAKHLIDLLIELERKEK